MRPPASIDATLQQINKTLQSCPDGPYSKYSCQTVSWDDVNRGIVGGNLSCWGANITDTRLYAKDERSLFTVREDNWNERLAKVSSDDIALVATDEDGGGGCSNIRPVTLRTVLSDSSRYGGYAGLIVDDLADDILDKEVSVRFQTTFLPVEAGDDKSTIEFCPEAYNYNTTDDSNPRNLIFLCTTQGVAIQQDGKGAKKLYHHTKSGSEVHRYWLEAESSNHKVGCSQVETKAEKEDALKRGKATSSVIGVEALGTRFNVLMTIQVPLKKTSIAGKFKNCIKKLSKTLSCMCCGSNQSSKSMSKLESSDILGIGNYVDMPPVANEKISLTVHDEDEEEVSKKEPTKLEMYPAMPDNISFTMPDHDEEEAIRSAPVKFGMSLAKPDNISFTLPEEYEEEEITRSVPAFNSMLTTHHTVVEEQPIFRSCHLDSLGGHNMGGSCHMDSLGGHNMGGDLLAGSAQRRAKTPIVSSAARVSRGTFVDTWNGLTVQKPRRHTKEHITVTIVMYYTCSGGVPTEDEVKEAINDIELLYQSLGNGYLDDSKFDFMKSKIKNKTTFPAPKPDEPRDYNVFPKS